jgi:hypothetical protein
LNAGFQKAIARFDEENSKDPHLEPVPGEPVPRELLYARRLTSWIFKLEPNPSEALQLAARCQHIRRWEIPRIDFPADKMGYHRWRTKLKIFHAAISAKILRDCGYDDATIARVQELNLKKTFPSDPESRTLEDGLCLVFLEFQLDEFAQRTDRDKVINALRKSWGKMTERGRAAALALPLSGPARELVAEAIRPG